MSNTGHLYGTIDQSIKILPTETKGWALNTLEHYHIYRLSKQVLEVNDTTILITLYLISSYKHIHIDNYSLPLISVLYQLSNPTHLPHIRIKLNILTVSRQPASVNKNTLYLKMYVQPQENYITHWRSCITTCAMLPLQDKVSAKTQPHRPYNPIKWETTSLQEDT
jgi:hypothetical protein